MRLTLLAFPLALAAVSLSAAASPLSEKLDAFLQKTAATTKISGTAGVRKANELYFKGIRQADDARGLVNGRDTIFLIASNTKQFTGAAILKLEEEGLLKTSDPLTKFFPDYPLENVTGANGQVITIEQLARHETGLTEVYALPEIQAKLFREPLSFQDFYAAIKGQKLKFDPGTKYEYSNMAYLFLGEIVRRVSGTSFSEFARAKLFAPAGLESTTVGPPSDTENLAQCYDPSTTPRQELLGKMGIVVPHTDETFTDGNIFSTAPDLIRWIDALVGGKVLGPDALQKMLAPSPLGNYGYGISVKKTNEGETFYVHTGRWLGFDSLLATFPARDLSVTFLSNQNLSDEEQNFYTELLKTAREL
jgi:D-alanyl-D-alanine carboxypeptidase